MKIECVVLDWSGVISEDLEMVWHGFNAVLAHFGKPQVTFEDFRKEFYQPFMLYYRDKGIDAPYQETQKIYETEYKKYKAKLIPGVKESLKKVREKGVMLAVLSSQYQEALDIQAREYGIIDYFDVLAGGVIDKREWLESFIKRLGLQREEVVFAGDMTHDVEAGKKAGVKTVAMLGGHNSEEKLRKSNPDFLFKELSEIVSLID